MVSFKAWMFYPRKEALCTHWIGGLVGPRTGLDDVAKKKNLPCPCQAWNLGRPARNVVTKLNKLSQFLLMQYIH